MRNELKDTIRDLFSRIDACEEGFEWEDLKFEAKLDLLSYLAYLSASDGIIHKREVGIINEYLDARITVKEIKEFISKFEINSDSFKESVPKTFRALVFIDNALLESGYKNRCGMSEMWSVVSKVLGIKMILADGEADGDEIFHLMNYIIELEKYFEKNLLSRQRD